MWLNFTDWVALAEHEVRIIVLEHNLDILDWDVMNEVQLEVRDMVFPLLAQYAQHDYSSY